MKVKLKKNSQGLALTLRSTGHEELIYPEAESARAGGSQVLFSFTYKKEKKGYEFQYIMGPAQKLEEVLSQPLPREYLEGMLLSFLTLTKDCDRLNLSMQRVILQNDSLFFDFSRYALVFVYVPLHSITQNLSSALDALEYISLHVRPADASSQQLIQAVYDFSKRSAIFSWIEYEKFLQTQGVLEKRTETKAPHIRLKETQSIDCRESFGFDFVKEAMSADKQRLAENSQSEKSENKAATRSVNFCLLEVNTGKTWPLRPGENEVGALPSASIALVDRVGVSRHHAMIYAEPDGVSILDLHSTNGVYVNGKRLPENTKKSLCKEDVIHFARESFILKRQ